MKQKIFMYLFIFTALIVLFQYVSSKRIMILKGHKIESLEKRVENYKDSIISLQDQTYSLSHFNLDRNEDAIGYFEKEGYDVDSLIPFIKDEIYKLNEVKGQHPLVPYASSSGRKLMVNTIKLLNHKWIIADFSDGEFWGELFITYQVTSKKEVEFQVVESFLYPLN
ncbi:hydrolase [Mariniflexile ostreae]|uniref:Hydrolase n=1 Tax=Mariniflexile ostreae TaxID=1520892 RepID=A0ABV5FDR3_9FLAO